MVVVFINFSQFFLSIAPNSYNIPDSDKVMHEHSPKYSFGVKAHPEKPSDTPGGLFYLLHYNYFHIFFFNLAPNCYNIPESDKVMHEHSPMYSFGVRVHPEKLLDTPGWLLFYFFNLFLYYFIIF